MNQPHPVAPSARRPAPALSSQQRGFTLLELCVTVGILALLLATGVTALGQVGASMKLSAFTNSFVSHFQFARTEAIKRNSRVVICKSSGGDACAREGGWEQGWIVFHDRNNNGAREANEPVIRRGDALPPGYRVVGNQPVARYLSFTPFGGNRSPGGAFQAGTITICRESLERSDARQVVINAAGRPRILKTKLPACVA
jgi:type IV fimbrial biogenesis protein FimT